ncbi:hypothetical protein ACWOFR_00865 [Carnobacterium gallinarum]|uniref:hypothetical protein n=1 Tax=Carnobacterium gallinarum TaxID=2749 RepID=UPI00054D89E6|nr:hypothetical protein [Carnobacterium gallinarum]
MSNIYTDKEKMKIAKKEYENLKLGGKVTINNGKKIVGYVSQINDKPTGEQSFVITDTYVPTTFSLEERSQVKEIIILYRGSTSPDKITTEFSDVYKDWMVNDISLTSQVMGTVQGKPTPQLVSSAETLKNALALYPNAQVYVYGHSLGSMNAQYSLADLPESSLSRVGGGYFYQGPNLYSTLTLQQQNTADRLTVLNKLYNYVDPKDLVPIGYGAGKPTVGHSIYVSSKKVGAVDQHMWGGYQYDKHGNVLTDKKGAIELAKAKVNHELEALFALKKKFMATGGGKLSASQEVFLDSAEALSIIEGMKQTVKHDISELKKIYVKGIENAGTLWKESLESAREVGAHLSEIEMIEALANGGATVSTIVGKPITEYDDSLQKLTLIEEKYDTLLVQITESIATQLKMDQELASQLGSA